MSAARVPAIQVALEDPHDANLTQADARLCGLGSDISNIQAAVSRLAGKVAAKWTLPVSPVGGSG